MASIEIQNLVMRDELRNEYFAIGVLGVFPGGRRQVQTVVRGLDVHQIVPELSIDLQELAPCSPVEIGVDDIYVQPAGRAVGEKRGQSNR